jgi:flagellar FliL protein
MPAGPSRKTVPLEGQAHWGDMVDKRRKQTTVMFTRKRYGKSMLIMLIGCGLGSVALGVGAGLFMGKRAQAGEAHGAGKRSHKEKARGADAEEVAMIYPIGELVVNLADTDSMRYAKATVAFGFQETVPEEKLKSDEPILRDAVISVLTRRTFKELHRRGGIAMVKKEILAATSDRIRDATISEIYLEGFAMQ